MVAPTQDGREPAPVERQSTKKSEQQSFKPILTLKQQASAKEIISNVSEGASFGKLNTIKESSEPKDFQPMLEEPLDKTFKSAFDMQNTSALSGASIMHSLG